MRAVLFALLLAFAAAPASYAQGAFGIGGQGGDPTGVTVRLGPVDAAVEFDFQNAGGFFAQSHYLLRDAPIAIEDLPLSLFYGVGAFVGAEQGARAGTRDFYGGVSTNFGVSYFPLRGIEVFGQLTPRLRLAPNTVAELGPAIGIRFYP